MLVLRTVRYNGIMASKLADLAAQALKVGWASGSGSIALLRLSAGNLSWSEVAFRSADPPVMSLRPLGSDEARPNSLSSRYGKAAQPLHTDGAHMPEPPDFVLLLAEKASKVPTLLWKCEIIHYQLPSYTDLRHGVFLVNNGTDSFFRTAASGLDLRYDPGCMAPCDERARRTARFFAAVTESAVEHHWDAPGKVLLIDNRRVLHARAAAEDEPGREIKRVAFRAAVSIS
jgi:alpha-ketoglutarate-dependent taurine dioxygenase